jgi:hypothetical protein
MIPSDAEDFLKSRGAHRTPHSGSTLLHHLAGVHAILQASGADEALCLAGLFHSVYGTTAFRPAIVPHQERDAVAHVIGPRAEALVWIFSSLRRPAAFEESLASDGDSWADSIETSLDKRYVAQALVRLECANLLEQQVLFRFPRLLGAAKAAGMLDSEGFAVRCGPARGTSTEGASR